ncbi:Cytoplasmic dynein 1 light intermediate chain 1 [Acipenser ruthenus]|uniref:Dynein light intermediate chain n=1 Tax=Acipenser ruthenus TaxID=7906 RepID=A0A662YQQ7_ACIRT|nr:Cytoplasmic dynein 1 light intermediate chain 1 [Acipenser ruthenus]
MAAVDKTGSSSSISNINNNTQEIRNGEDDDLWSSILSEVTTHSRSKLPSGKNVFVMGEDGAGKTTLLARLQGIEEYMKGRGLEYLYFNVHDEDIDDHARCNAWILDGDLYHKGLQKFALSASNIRDTLAVLVVDMARPWTVLDSLQKWSSVFREYIDKLKIPPEEIKEMEHRLLRQFQEYTDPGEDLGTPQRRNTSLQEEEDETVVLPLGENTLTHNLGVPLLVICTKFVHEKEIVAEDDQVFLIKLQSLLAKQPPVAAGRPVDASNRVPGSPRTPNRSGTTNVASVTPIPSGTKKIDPNMKAGTTSEGVLANFFNSLLSKKTGSPGSGGSTPGGGGGNLSGSAKKSEGIRR